MEALKDQDHQLRLDAAKDSAGHPATYLASAVPALGAAPRTRRNMSGGRRSSRSARSASRRCSSSSTALKDNDAKMCRMAIEALGGIGPDAKPAFPALAEVLMDNDETVRLAAVEALAGIGAQRPHHRRPGGGR